MLYSRVVPTVTLVAGIALTAAPVSAEEFRLRIGSGHSPSWHFIQLAREYFIPEVQRRVAEETEHTVTFVEGWSGSMVQVTEVLQAVETGVLDIGMYCICHEAQRLALNNFPMYLPFGPNDPAVSSQVTRAVYDAHPELGGQFERYGQRLLGLVPFEPYNIVARSAISEAREVQGLRIGAAGPNAFWVESAGALPVSVGGPDMYTSFQTGLIDGMVIFLSVMESLKLFEVAPNFIDVSFGSMTVTALTINENRLNRLPEDVRNIILEVGSDMEAHSGPFTRDLVEQTMAGVESQGVNVVRVSDEERAAWAEMLQAASVRVGQRYAEETGLPVLAVMQTYLDAAEAAGHTWPARPALD